jgi:hypothetical protein
MLCLFSTCLTVNLADFVSEWDFIIVFNQPVYHFRSPNLSFFLRWDSYLAPIWQPLTHNLPLILDFRDGSSIFLYFSCWVSSFRSLFYVIMLQSQQDCQHTSQSSVEILNEKYHASCVINFLFSRNSTEIFQ